MSRPIEYENLLKLGGFKEAAGSRDGVEHMGTATAMMMKPNRSLVHSRDSTYRSLFATLSFAALTFLPFIAHSADAPRQAEVAQRGADVMPFSVRATTHIFTKTADGGTQRVVAKRLTDVQQVRSVREHLQDIRAQFLKGNFSGPTHVHGVEMPGLSELKAARLGQMTIDYKNVDGGGELTYQSTDATLVAALHEWFDAQLSDHGADAMAGHHHAHDMMRKP